MRFEATENRSLPSLLAPQLRSALIRISGNERSRHLALRALRGLARFAKSLKVHHKDIEVGFDFDPEPGLADNGNLESDMQDLFEAVSIAAEADGRCVALLVDEVQCLRDKELAALVLDVHRNAQRSLPLTMVGAGLPKVLGRAGKAKSYAERVLEFPQIGALSAEDTSRAIAKPVQDEGVQVDADVCPAIDSRTQGYPYFLQEWGKCPWEIAERSPITYSCLEAASELAIASLDARFFRVRFDRLTPAEKRIARAMAKLGPGPHCSGDIARVLDRPVTALAPTRNHLINKGMAWSPSHGDTACTVPMFDEFMRRIMPGDSW